MHLHCTNLTTLPHTELTWVSTKSFSRICKLRCDEVSSFDISSACLVPFISLNIFKEEIRCSASPNSCHMYAWNQNGTETLIKSKFSCQKVVFFRTYIFWVSCFLKSNFHLHLHFSTVLFQEEQGWGCSLLNLAELSCENTLYSMYLVYFEFRIKYSYMHQDCMYPGIKR